MYDLIIIGGGAAGLTAAMYAGRSGLKTLLIEKMFIGGQAATTYEIENYPGFATKITGPDLMMKMEDHAKLFGSEFKFEDVVDINIDKPIKEVNTSTGKYKSKTLIIATGANPKELGIAKEKDFRGAGISYCATCDGAFYRDKKVAVIGGGDTAVEDALFLSRFCSKVYLIHRRDELRAVKVLRDAIMANDKIEIIWDTVVEEIIADQTIKGLKIKNKKTNQINNLQVSGVFVAIGVVPNNKVIANKLAVNDAGYIITDDMMQTNVAGVYAAGDIREKSLRQIVTAAADGAIAAFEVGKYIG